MARYIFATLIALALLAGAPFGIQFGIAPAEAQQIGGVPLLDRDGNPFRVQRMTGKHITFPNTYDVFDFGFESDYVEICMYPSSSTSYARFGIAVTADSAGNPGIEGNPATFVTSDTIFRNGDDGTTYGSIAGRAFALSMVSGATESNCHTYPWATRGLVFNNATTSSASLDVNAFSAR